MTRPKYSMLVAYACAIVFVGLTNGQALGQSDPPHGAPARMPRTSQSDRAAERAQAPAGTLNIEFPGGMVEQYVDLIREMLQQRREPANIMVKDDARLVSLPAIDLVDVSLESALVLLHHHVGQLPAGDNVMLNLDVLHGDGAPIYVVATRQQPISAHSPRPQRDDNKEVVNVWNVSELLFYDMKADDMLTAIETAISLVRSADEEAEIRFHEATGLIIARGTVEQISTMNQVIDQLHASAKRSAVATDQARRAKQASEAQAALEARNQELNAIRHEFEAIKREREALLNEVKALQERHEMSIREHQASSVRDQTHSAREVAELEHMVRQLQDELKKAKGEGE